MPSPHAHHWQLNPDVDYLNHGSFGATPRVVMESRRMWIEQLECDPIQFLGPERTLMPKLDSVREKIAELVNAPTENLVFVRNSTDGVNAVLRSLPLHEGDEIVITSHGYNACNNVARAAADRAGAAVKTAVVPFPIQSAAQVLGAIDEALSPRTRLLLVDHVTSATGLVFPIDEVVELARERNVRVMVDGAHAPGMCEVDLRSLDPDYYTANHHKWLCGPKTSGLLYVRGEYTSEVRPTILSHGVNTQWQGRSKFQAEFDWPGTFDPSPILSMPAAIEFISSLHAGGLPALRQANHELAVAGRQVLLDRLDLAEPAPSAMLGSLATIPLPKLKLEFSGGDHGPEVQAGANAFQMHLFHKHRIEVPVFTSPTGAEYLRVSAQAYNDIGQYERLASAIHSCLAT